MLPSNWITSTWLDQFVLVNMVFMVFQVLTSIMIIVFEEKETERGKRHALALDRTIKYTQITGSIIINITMIAMGYSQRSSSQR